MTSPIADTGLYSFGPNFEFGGVGTLREEGLFIGPNKGLSSSEPVFEGSFGASIVGNKVTKGIKLGTRGKGEVTIEERVKRKRGEMVNRRAGIKQCSK